MISLCNGVILFYLIVAVISHLFGNSITKAYFQKLSANASLDPNLEISTLSKLRQINWGRSLAFVFGILLTINSTPHVLSVFLLFMIDSSVAFKNEKKIRKLEAGTVLHFFELIRAILVYLVFWVVLMTSWVGSFFAFDFVFDLLHLPHSGLIALVPSLLFMYFTASGFAPLGFRLIHRLKSLDEGELRGRIEAMYLRRGMRRPQIFIMDTDKFKSVTAMICGFNWAPGVFRQAVVFSKNSLKEFTSEELMSIMGHEISHAYFNHIAKRIYMTTAAVVIASCLAIPFDHILISILPGAPQEVLFALGMIALFMMVFFPIRRLVRIQEMEADFESVRTFKSSIEDMTSALTKLARLNGMDPNTKTPESYFDVGAAHPTINKRVEAVRLRLERVEKKEKPFCLEDWYEDLFMGKMRWVTSAVGVALILFAVSLPTYWAPRHRVAVAAIHGDVTKLSILKSQGVNLNETDLLAGKTPLFLAIERNKFEAVKFLLEQGIDPNFIPPGSFRKPIEVARKIRNEDMVALLVKYGAVETKRDLSSTNKVN